MKKLIELARRFHGLLIVAAITVLFLYVFNDALDELLSRVLNEGQYSHAPMVLLVSLYFIWIRRANVFPVNSGRWAGVGLVCLASLFLVVGELAAIWTIVQYSLVLLIIGLIWAMMGNQIKAIIMPLILIFFVIPLPFMIDVILSGKMQLLSSQLGVSIVRMLGMSVFLEGNVIDLGSLKLQVVEACSGLNYMFPLMTIGLIVAYMYIAPMVARALIFISTIPISIGMNSLRISIVALLVSHFGNEAASGFMHYFEGWIVFISCILLLLLEVKIINSVMNVRTPLADSFDIYSRGNAAVASPSTAGMGNRPLAVSLIVIVIAVFSTLMVGKRMEIVPDKKSFAEFPLTIDRWSGTSRLFTNNENDILRLSDYLLADLADGENRITVYIGYTESQRKGFVPHSPKACIPGGGWEISDASIRELSAQDGRHFSVTRLLISRGEERQIVYYWFRQRGRDLSNEYSMKLALLYDAIRINRTDGAIVRFSMPVKGSVEKSDTILKSFIGLVYPKLPEYIPD